MKTIDLDLETFSSENIQKCGLYRYSEADDFEILLLGCSVDGGPVHVFDIANGEMPPQSVIDGITDDSAIKYAHNAMFERVCLSRWLKLPDNTFLNPGSWRCTMVWCAYMGLPLALKGAAEVLNLKLRKMDEGTALIRHFCCPCRPTASNSGRTRNLPSHSPDRWETFKRYNHMDVEVEKEIRERLSKYPVPDEIWDQYAVDQHINDRGIMIDIDLVDNAIGFDARIKEQLVNDIRTRTELENPNSVQQMRSWLRTHDIFAESLDKKAVAAMMETAPDEVRDILTMRLQLARSSVSKYQAMRRSVCRDGRIRGCFQFYGTHTGRWAGRLVQLQNLPRNLIDDLDEARRLVRDGDYEKFRECYRDAPEVLSQLVRTAFIPGTKEFIVADFSAIEARIIAWLSKETWRINSFRDNKDIYSESASQMFGVPVEKHGVNSELRQKGKIAELALGYGGAVGALISMGALEKGLDEEELPGIVDAWRAASPKIVSLWWAVDDAAKETIRTKEETETHGIRFLYRKSTLFITLPSGRILCYPKPHISENRFGGESITYEGVGTTRKWERIETYGPRLVENIVQAIARDLLAYAIGNLRNTRICASVHDELIIEAEEGMSVSEICEEMSRTPEWAKGLLLRADGYSTPYYRKD